jgi:hypothetical protein
MKCLIFFSAICLVLTCGVAVAKADDEYVDLEIRQDDICMMNQEGQTVCFKGSIEKGLVKVVFDPDSGIVTVETVKVIK